MSGLYERALEFLNLTPRKDIEDEFAFDEDSGISHEDQKEILAEIEKESSKSRITITPEIFTIRALKRGVLFPLMMNLFLITILAGGVLFFYFLFQRGETTMMQEGAAITTAEGKLIAELKKESEEKLLEKNKEISQIQTRMEEINKEREDLQKNMDVKIQDKEQELRDIMEIELKAEREKLKKQGISEEDINRKLTELESQKTEQYNRQLDTYKVEAENERKKMEESLEKLQDEYSSSLELAEQERRRVLDESKKREQELESQLAEKTRALETEKVQAAEELKRLSVQKEQEELASTRLVGFYNTVEKNIKSGELDKALLSLDGIVDYLNSEEVISLPGMLKRRDVEFFMVDSIRSMVQAEMKKEEVDTGSLIASANLVTEIRNNVLEADDSFNRGNIEEAEKKYSRALSLIPEISKSHDFFITREMEKGTSLTRQLSEYISRAETAFKKRNFSDTLINYAKALDCIPEDSADTERMISQMKQAGFVLGMNSRELKSSQEAAEPLAAADEFLSNEKYNDAILAYSNLIAEYPYGGQVESALKGINKAVEAKSGISLSTQAELEKALEQRDAELNELKTSLEERTEEADTLQKTLTERTGELEETLKSRLSQIESLQNEKRVLSEEIVSLKTDIEELQKARETAPVKTELDEEIKQKIERLEKIKAAYEKVVNSYTKYAAQEDRLISSLGEERGLMQSKVNLNSFLASNERSFPGLYERIKRYDAAFERAGQEVGRDIGMEHAMKAMTDILEELSLREREEAKVLFLQTEMVRRRDDPIVVELLQELIKQFE